MVVISCVLIVISIKFCILEENPSKVINEIIEEIIEHSELNSDNINVTSVENKTENVSNTYYIETNDQPKENGQKLDNDSNIEIGSYEDVYKVSDATTLDPKAHIEVTKIAEDNSTVKIEYAPQSIQYIIEDENTTLKVVNDSEDQYTEKVDYPDAITNNTNLENIDYTPHEPNNFDVSKSRRSGSLRLKVETLISEVNEMKSLYEYNKQSKVGSEIKGFNPVINKPTRTPLVFLPYNFMLHNVNPTPPVTPVVYQRTYLKNFIVKPSLYPRRMYSLRNYKIGSPIVQRVMPKIRQVYSYLPTYIG